MDTASIQIIIQTIQQQQNIENARILIDVRNTAESTTYLYTQQTQHMKRKRQRRARDSTGTSGGTGGGTGGGIE
jgi:hypothetical protein